MILREWRCRCPVEHGEGFLAWLRETGLRDALALPACRGAQILTRDLDNGRVEITLQTCWDSLEAIHAYAGEDIEQARLYPGDERYAIEPELTVRHYRVAEQLFRAAP